MQRGKKQEENEERERETERSNGTKGERKTHGKHDGMRRREVAEGNEREPLLQREIRERGGEGRGR